MNVVDENIDRIKALCEKHKVAKLFVFGSVLTNEFEEGSDIDFLVDFSGIDLYEYADNYFNLKDSLEELLGREIDLLEDKAIKNPYLRSSIDSSKRLIYGYDKITDDMVWSIVINHLPKLKKEIKDLLKE